MSNPGGIWVLGEVDEENRLSPKTLGLLGLAGKLAEGTSQTLNAVFIGQDVRTAAEESIRRGADRAHVCENPSLSEYEGEAYVQALERICADARPDIILAAHTAIGQDLLPRAAARLNTHVVTECVGLSIERATGSLLMTKPVYGGNALAEFACESRPQMATVRTTARSAPHRDPVREGELVLHEFQSAEVTARPKLIQKTDEATTGVKLEDAETIVSGGRGIGSAEGFNQLRELAQLLGGAVGASRPPCDLGWISPHCQVGLTGKMVAPALYFAVAISGTMQHITGMSEAQRVVAINKDEGAAIFKMADYGVVGDYREALPAFIKKLTELPYGADES